MTTGDLFEMAALDALGLLDREEREAFEHAFRSAPASVQAQIRREQVRYSDIDDWLPEVEAPAGLRARVLARVREAMVSIHQPAGRIAPMPARAATTAFWRAACIGFATATIILSGFVYTVAQKNQQITAAAINNSLTAEIAELGGSALASVLTSPGLRPVSFSPPARDAGTATGVRASANLLVDTETKTAYLLCKDLPIASGEYTLVIGADKSLAARRIKRFRVDSPVLGIPIEGVSGAGIGRLEIRSPRGPGGKSSVVLESEA